ncbi:hypothetical protein FACS1894186_5650 [Alphaproteobacteria bacterium]|nr:hypothetical protein FACS1894186_5650 [Alphaproteobacteria bacterium]
MRPLIWLAALLWASPALAWGADACRATVRVESVQRTFSGVPFDALGGGLDCRTHNPYVIKVEVLGGSGKRNGGCLKSGAKATLFGHGASGMFIPPDKAKLSEAGYKGVDAMGKYELCAALAEYIQKDLDESMPEFTDPRKVYEKGRDSLVAGVKAEVLYEPEEEDAEWLPDLDIPGPAWVLREWSVKND